MTTKIEHKSKRKASEIDCLIGQNIRNIRLSQNISQEQLAKILGTSFQQIQKYESGKNRISASSLFRLAEFTNAPIDAFFYGAKDFDKKKSLPPVIDKELFALFDLFQKIPDQNMQRQIKTLLKSYIVALDEKRS